MSRVVDQLNPRLSWLAEQREEKQAVQGTTRHAQSVQIGQMSDPA